MPDGERDRDKLQRGPASTNRTRRPLRITLRPTSVSKETSVEVGVPSLSFLRSCLGYKKCCTLDICPQKLHSVCILAKDPWTVGKLEGFGMGLWKSWKTVPSHSALCWPSLLGDASFPGVMPQDLCPETVQLVL